eukprot:351652-Chlamydomonas_euryale.AAC.6
MLLQQPWLRKERHLTRQHAEMHTSSLRALCSSKRGNRASSMPGQRSGWVHEDVGHAAGGGGSGGGHFKFLLMVPADVRVHPER